MNISVSFPFCLFLFSNKCACTRFSLESPSLEVLTPLFAVWFCVGPVLEEELHCSNAWFSHNLMSCCFCSCIRLHAQWTSQATGHRWAGPSPSRVAKIVTAYSPPPGSRFHGPCFCDPSFSYFYPRLSKFSALSVDRWITRNQRWALCRHWGSC